jgi:hypothetical protein
MLQASTVINKRQIPTEKLGKTFEKSICKIFQTPFVGNYNYNTDEADKLSLRIQQLRTIFPHDLIHTAAKGGRYDFISSNNTDIKLSAKTTKSSDKVCPQVIGQPSKKKFREHFGITDESTNIKEYIQDNVNSMLDKYFEYTFDCPIVYYNDKKDLALLVTTIMTIDWSSYTVDFSHRRKKTGQWNESTTISIAGIVIGEFQVHNHRDNIKFRWNFINILQNFAKHFEIIPL